MPLNPDALTGWTAADITETVTPRNAMLYALSLGLPFDEADDELRYVYEKDLVVFPTLPVVLGRPEGWHDNPAFGVTRPMMVHWAQRLEVTRPVTSGQVVVSSNAISEVLDRGPDRGGVIIFERTLKDAVSGEILAVSESTILCRADGGFGGRHEASRPYEPAPETPPDHVLTVQTDRRAAMFYRLNGDYNPLHIEPAFARRAGFDRPILHGLCSYGLAAAALRRIAGVSVHTQLARFEARFSRPILPGVEICVEAWGRGGDLRFRCRDNEGGGVILDMGRAVFAA